MNLEAFSFAEALSTLRLVMRKHGQAVHTETWQGMPVAHRPEAEMRELLNVDLTVPLRGNSDLAHWRADIKPNLPWADEHFDERVGGEPLNPPPSWVRWPWSNAADKSRTTEGGKFNHTYPERYWPKLAGDLATFMDAHAQDCQAVTIAREAGNKWPAINYCDCGLVGVPIKGIRHTYGDLSDVVQLLVDQPLTRQAWLPIFFPEDTGVGDGGRKPCTLGYQFIVRRATPDGPPLLHCYYPLRSCDLYRHLPDDIYLTVRLMLWVLEQCASRSSFWANVQPGSLAMHMTSLHVFVNDLRQL